MKVNDILHKPSGRPNFEPWMITDPGEIRQILVDSKLDTLGVSANKDGTVTLRRDLNVMPRGTHTSAMLLKVSDDNYRLRFKIKSAKKCGFFGLETLAGIPDRAGTIRVTGSFDSLVGLPFISDHISVTQAPNVKVWDAPIERSTVLRIEKTGITSLESVARNVRYLAGGMTVDSNITSGLVALLQCDMRWLSYMEAFNSDFTWATEIINKYLRMPLGDRDMLACKKELIKAGLRSFI